MMDSLRQYVFSVVCAAMILGILSSFAKTNAAGETVSLLCGMLLCIIMIHPLFGLIPELAVDLSASYIQEAEALSSEGKRMAAQAINDSIKQETESYILKKADALQVRITADISVNKEGIPTSVHISGDLSQESRRALEEIIETDLGITKENQIWTGQN